MALARKLTAKIYEIQAHNGNVTCLDLGETGRVLVTGGQDRNVNLWAIGQTECFMSLTGHNRPIECVKFAYSDDYVYSADDIGIIRRWDLNVQKLYSTLNGHMKSVRTLDFNPSGEYVVSGSNDTTVRLWDVKNQNKCIKIYRGHIAQVNSVKFSPDGLWIASAGTEGSVIIWDIRKSKQIMEFIEQPKAAAITCIQFHPFEFLLAVGRVDGVVCIYDLEREVKIASTDATSQFYGYPIKCITFSENGECLFVGTALGISVIGWEPDREFDQIKSAWQTIGDMKVVNNKLLTATYESDLVSVHALSISRVFPFYNPSNTTPAFVHNSITRKSFSRGSQKLRLSVASSAKPPRLVEENEDSHSASLDGHSSPNLSLELVDDSLIDVTFSSPSPPVSSIGAPPQTSLNETYTNGIINIKRYNDEATFCLPNEDSNINSSTNFHFNNYITNANTLAYSSNSNLSDLHFDGPSSLKMPGERNMFHQFNNVYVNELEYNLNDSNPPIINNYDNTEMVEDFPVNTNSHQQTNGSSTNSNSVGSTTGHNNLNSNHTTASKTTAKPKSTLHIQKRSTQIGITTSKTTTTSLQQRNKLSHVSSVSTTDLHKLDDNMVLKKSSSSNIVNKSRRTVDSQSQLNKENTRNKNITVQIITKPPTRSRTSLELRTSPNSANSAPKQSSRISSYTTESNTTNIPISYRPDPSLMTQSSLHQRGFNSRSNMIDDSSEIQLLSHSHEQVYQELSNRNATLQLIRNSTRSHDIVGALKQAIKFNGRTIFVDLLGAILEKTSTWNLDLCLLLLPEIYALLQSPHKFHYTRACDTLRVILSNFLPIIQENLDPWAASGLGVDVTREERQRKCLECHRWLLQIRSIPENHNFPSTTLTQLQNLITNV